MGVELAKKIDRYLGVPLCALLSAWERARRLVQGRVAPRDAVARILFVQLSEMGSIVLAYPAVLELKARYPSAQLFFLTLERLRPCLNLLPLIPEDQVLCIRDDSLVNLLRDAFSVVRRARRLRFDVLFDFELFSRISAILGYLTGATKRIGFHRFHMEGLYRGNLHTHRMAYSPHVHVAGMFRSFVDAVELAGKTVQKAAGPVSREELRPPRLPPDASRLEAASRKLAASGSSLPPGSELVLLSPYAGPYLNVRAWPVEYFAALARRLLEKAARSVIVVGTEEARDSAGAICSLVASPRCINLAGETSLHELLGLFEMSSGLVANDSGAAHMASVTETQIFVLFGPETPVLYAPLGERVTVFYAGLPCSPCLSAYNHRTTSCTDNRCLKTISVEEVYRRVEQRLGETRSGL